jgi:ATP/maltotriose-dependent transcriptional regulator MalT
MNALLLCAIIAGALEVDASDYLEELEDLAADDLHARFRLASASTWCAFGRPSLAGAWQRVGSLIPLADDCDGAMLKSDLLGGAAYLSVLRGDYALAAGLAEQAAAVAADFKLRVPHAFCLLYLANAELGRGNLGRAQTLLRSVEEGECVQRDSVRIAAASTRLKLELSRRQGFAASDEAVLADKAARSSRGAYAALGALAAAVAGDAAGTRARTETARALTHGAEARFYVRYAELVVTMRTGGAVDSGTLAQVLQETLDAEIPDTFVTAYRAAPELLRLAAEHPVAAVAARRIVRSAHDLELARGVGLVGDDEAGDGLTSRESEVLRLMAEGLSNADIARELFLSPRTVKVHVHHILGKLDAKSRLEAVLKRQGLVPTTAGEREDR